MPTATPLPEVAVRAATPSNAEAIARVHVTTWREAYRGLVDQALLDGLSDADHRERWTRLLGSGSPGREHLVATAGGSVIGFAAIGPCRDDGLDPARVGEIHAMYVLPSAWGSGAGRGLMTASLQRLGLGGYTAVTLWVLTANARARRFYERAGFLPDGATAAPRKGGVDLPSTRYRRSLAAD